MKLYLTTSVPKVHPDKPMDPWAHMQCTEAAPWWQDWEVDKTADEDFVMKVVYVKILLLQYY